VRRLPAGRARTAVSGDSLMRYVTCCVESTDELISDMTASETELTYAEFCALADGVDEWAAAHGYDTDFPITADEHVSYHKSTYGGAPCVYLQWSGIEYIWLWPEPGTAEVPPDDWGYGTVPHTTRFGATNFLGER
jgi:hypothetical protein